MESNVTGPALVLLDIRACIERVTAMGVKVERVHLTWPLYRDLLLLRDLDTSPEQRDAWGTEYENRPLTKYRYPLTGEEYDLILDDHQSAVYGVDAVGNTAGYAL